jgi:hypothetical protein
MHQGTEGGEGRKGVRCDDYLRRRGMPHHNSATGGDLQRSKVAKWGRGDEREVAARLYVDGRVRRGQHVRRGSAWWLHASKQRRKGKEWGGGGPIVAARGGEGEGGCLADVRTEWAPPPVAVRP